MQEANCNFCQTPKCTAEMIIAANQAFSWMAGQPGSRNASTVREKIVRYNIEHMEGDDYLLGRPTLQFLH